MNTILRVESLTKNYGELKAINSLSFEVFEGEIFGFLGPNGAGKTTTMRIMSGLLDPDDGKVFINFGSGESSIGICPQDIVIWDNLSCLEQLIYMGRMYDLPERDSRKKALELLESFGLLEKKNRLAKTLSGGMKRRLNISLALIHSPAIVFLDEPQAGLDPQSRVLVRDYILSIKGKTTVILTTHDMEEAGKLSDRICIIDRGKILATGTTEQLKKMSGEEDLIEVETNEDPNIILIPFLDTMLKYDVLVSEKTACFRVSDSYAVMSGILETIKKRNIKINGIRLRKKSLEDAFISMTGRDLRE